MTQIPCNRPHRRAASGVMLWQSGGVLGESIHAVSGDDFTDTMTADSRTFASDSAIEPFPGAVGDPAAAGARLAARAAGAESRPEAWTPVFARLFRQGLVMSGAPGGPGAGGPDGSHGEQLASRLPADADSPAALAAQLRRLAPAQEAGVRVALDFSGAVPDCDALAQQLAAIGASRRSTLGLSFGLAALDSAALRALARATRPVVGARLIARIPDELMRSLAVPPASRSAGARQAAALWDATTAAAWAGAPWELVFEATTRSCCALAGGERCEAVLPLSLFEVPAESAWLSLQLDVSRLDAGASEPRAIAATLLRMADNLLDQHTWPLPAMRHDARLNRRLAIHLVGLGDWVRSRGLDPDDPRSLRALDQVVASLAASLRTASWQLARDRGPFPGLRLNDMVARLAPHLGRLPARRLLAARALRHRHLVAMSPFCCLPSEQAAPDPGRYLALLPVLRHADTVALFGARARRRLALTDYRRLLRMSWFIAGGRG